MTNEEAIKNVNDVLLSLHTRGRVKIVIPELIEALNMAVGALNEKNHPRRSWGKWVISEVRCPECLEYFDTDCYDEGTLNTCPNCGMDMKRT